MKILWKNYLYEAVITEAYSKDDITRIYGKNIEDYIKDPKNGYNEINPTAIGFIKENIIEEIMKADPSADKKYLGQITKWLLEKRPEDLETQIKEYLNRFKKILDIYPGGEVGGISKELSKGKLNLDAFKNKVIELEKKFATNLENPDLKASKTSSNFKIVGQNETYVCFEVDKWLSEGDDGKHLCFSGDVDWCVKYRDYFDQYKPPYFYFMEKATGKEFALMHIGSSQLKDVRDMPLSHQDAEKIKDIIYPILKKYSEGENIISFTGDFEVIWSIFSGDQTAYNELKMYVTAWFDYVKYNNLSQMKKLFDEYEFSIDVRDNDTTRTALMVVCQDDRNYESYYSNDDISKWLIDNGANVNLKDDMGRTPLYFACQKAKVKIVEQLIAAGADVNSKTNNGDYPIEYGAFTASILEKLLNAGATIDIDKNILLNITRADVNGNKVESAALLLKAGADPNKMGNWGVSPIRYANRRGRTRLFKLFDHYNQTGEVVIPPEESNGPSDEELARELKGI
jgi:ankyrin repeat protein